MLSSRLATALALLACAQVAVAAPANTPAKTAVSGAQAPQIPAKYHGVYARTHARCTMQEGSAHVPWLVVTARSVHRDEALCNVTAVKPNVSSGVDALSFDCAEEGTESTQQEAWSLEFQTEGYGNLQVSQPFLVRRGIESGKINSKDVSRLRKCGLQAIELR